MSSNRDTSIYAVLWSSQISRNLKVRLGDQIETKGLPPGTTTKYNRHLQSEKIGLDP